MQPASFKKKIVAGFAWQSASVAIIQIFSWTTTILVARILAPEDYGIVAIQGVFTVTIGMVVDMGVSRGLIQKEKVTDKQLDSLFYFSLLFGGVAYAAYYWAAPVIAGFYQIPELTSVLRVAGLTFIFGSIKSVPIAITMRNLDFKYRSFVELFGAFVQASSLLVFALHGLGYWSLIYSLVLGYFVTMIAYFPIMGRVPKIRLVIAEVTDVLAFGIKVMFTRLMFVVYTKADVFVLGKFSGGAIDWVLFNGFAAGYDPVR